MTDEKNSSRKATKAPPPICPLDQQPIVSLRTSGLESSPPEPANWKYWKNVATVELGQALLLSINVEPLGGGLLIGNAPKTGWRITPGYLNATGKADIFDERWHLIRNKLETAYAASGLPPKIDLHTFIRLPLFATIAIQLGWEDLPPELLQLAEQKEKKPSSTDTGPEIEHSGGALNAQRTIPRQRHQEEEIIRVITELGLDPINLPKDIKGRPGVKKNVRDKLSFSHSVFEKAWERLSSAGDIKKQK